MKFREYQEATAATAVYPGQGTATGLAYVGLGLGEAGEVQGKIKKVLRDDEGILTARSRQAIADELGDLLWYVARAAEEIDYDLNSIAIANLVKLRNRAERGTLQGSGDDR
jgi:NTP pyrophosphatase (non-canonical NTP hydrolase)